MTYLRIYNIAIEINNWIGFTIKTIILLNFELCHIKFNSYSKWTVWSSQDQDKSKTTSMNTKYLISYGKTKKIDFIITFEN